MSSPIQLYVFDDTEVVEFGACCLCVLTLLVLETVKCGCMCCAQISCAQAGTLVLRAEERSDGVHKVLLLMYMWQDNSCVDVKLGYIKSWDMDLHSSVFIFGITPRIKHPCLSTALSSVLRLLLS